jgi:AmmeMemoRadiSam system protein A
MLSTEDRKTLLRIARETVQAELEGLYAPDVAAQSADLERPTACFVSLHNHGRLRGCIGTFQYTTPLHRIVRRMAGQALRDPRFIYDPVTAQELKDIDIEISVLSPLEKTKDPLAEIELGRHGIVIESPSGSGCFLPQVATETGWSKEEFLSRCASGKAHLPPDAWKSPDTTVYRFEAEVFGEKDI